MLSPPFENNVNGVHYMNEFDSENNSDDIDTPQVVRCHTLQQELLPSNFVPVIKPKKSCKTIISLNLLSCFDIVDNKKYFSDDEVHQHRQQGYKRKGIVFRRKEHSVMNDMFVNKTYDKFMNDNFHLGGTKGKQQGKVLQEGGQVVKERNTIYLSLQKRKEMKDK